MKITYKQLRELIKEQVNSIVFEQTGASAVATVTPRATTPTPTVSPAPAPRPAPRPVVTSPPASGPHVYDPSTARLVRYRPETGVPPGERRIGVTPTAGSNLLNRTYELFRGINAQKGTWTSTLRTIMNGLASPELAAQIATNPRALGSSRTRIRQVQSMIEGFVAQGNELISAIQAYQQEAGVASVSAPGTDRAHLGTEFYDSLGERLPIIQQMVSGLTRILSQVTAARRGSDPARMSQQLRSALMVIRTLPTTTDRIVSR